MGRQQFIRCWFR